MAASPPPTSVSPRGMDQLVSIKIATDLYTSKVNYVFDFMGVPSMHALKMKMESVFTRECELRRPPEAPPELFKIDHIQIFDPETGGWKELDNSGQLTTGSQLYVFQPPSQWHCDAQSGLPPPVKAPIHPVVDRFSSPPPPPPPPPLPVAVQVSPRRVPVMSPASPPPAVKAGLVLGELVESATVARAAAAAAEQEALEHGEKVVLQEVKAVEATRAAEVAAGRLGEAQRASLVAKEAFTAAAAAVDAAKVAERGAQADHLRSVDAITTAEARARAAETDLARADHRLADITRLLHEHRLQTDRQRELLAQCTADADAATQRVAHAEAAAEAACKAVGETEAALRAAREEAIAAETKATTAASVLAKVQEEVGERRAAVEATVSSLQAAKEVEALRRQEQAEAQRLVGVAQVRVMAQEEDALKAELRLKEVEGLYKMQELEVQRQRELCERCKTELENAKKRETEAGEAALQAQRGVHRAEDELMVAESALEKVLAAEREAQASSVLAAAEVDRAKASIAAKEQGVERALDRRKLADASLEEARTALQAADARKSAQDAELQSSLRKLQELEQLHADQVAEVEKHRTAAAEGRQEMLSAAAVEKEAAARVGAAQAAVGAGQEELLRRQADLAACQDVEGEASAAKLAADGDKAIHESLRQAAERQLEALKEREHARRAAEEDTLRAAELQSKLARSLEAEHLEHSVRRLAIEQELAVRGGSAYLPPY